MTLRIATRKSPLALAQTQAVVAKLRSLSPEVETIIVPLSSVGDDESHRPLTHFSEVGVFTKTLEQAILRGEADCALHCLKDLPAPLAEEFVLPAYLPREEPHDVLICGLDLDLDTVRKVATGSQRRRAFLGDHFPKWTFTDLRGNINTRIAKVVREEVEGIVLAGVGVNRLKKYYQENSPSSSEGEEGDSFLDSLERVRIISLPPDILLPAPGQGILALQCRRGDQETISRLSRLDHLPTRRAATVEREVMTQVEGGCRTPLGVWARLVASEVLWVEAAMERNQRIATAQTTGRVGEEEAIAQSIADRLLRDAT